MRGLKLKAPEVFQKGKVKGTESGVYPILGIHGPSWRKAYQGHDGEI